MQTFKKEFTEKVRAIVAEKLDQCTEKEVVLFNRMYGSINDVPFDKMQWAYIQCCNTLKKREKNEQ